MRYFILVWIGLAVACSSRPKATETLLSEQGAPSLVSESGREGAKRFSPMLPPAELDAEGRRLFLRDHYWDRFDFADTLLLRQMDSMELLNAFAGYVGGVLVPADTAAMRLLFLKASASRTMLERFHEMAELLLHDPNSPMRNDELYIPVLEQVIASPWYDEWEKIAPAHDLNIARQNRVGHKANDFAYTLADGTTRRLAQIKAPYTLLFISNPGCPMCGEVTRALTASPMLSEMIEREELMVLMLHPDEDLTEWQKHRNDVPQNWFYAYDRGCHLQKEQLYDLRAIPSLYLLDGQKRVLLKDVTEVPMIEWVLDHAR